VVLAAMLAVTLAALRAWRKPQQFDGESSRLELGDE